jgi:aspartyl-tRNA(Asn)/glutamyl-tRNA(Gln) amidotransferase subunit B
MRAAVRERMPELPATRRDRLVAEWGITESDARVLVAVPALADYAEAAVVALRAGTPKDVVNWSVGGVLAHLNDSGSPPRCCRWGLTASPSSSTSSPTARCRATRRRTSSTSACASRSARSRVVEERGLAQVSDEGELAAVVDTVLAENPSIVDEFRAADGDLRDKKLNALMGLAMRATKGQAIPPSSTASSTPARRRRGN